MQHCTHLSQIQIYMLLIIIPHVIKLVVILTLILITMDSFTTLFTLWSQSYLVRFRELARWVTLLCPSSVFLWIRESLLWHVCDHIMKNISVDDIWTLRIALTKKLQYILNLYNTRVYYHGVRKFGLSCRNTAHIYTHKVYHSAGALTRYFLL